MKEEKMFERGWDLAIWILVIALLFQALTCEC